MGSQYYWKEHETTTVALAGLLLREVTYDTKIQYTFFQGFHGQ